MPPEWFHNDFILEGVERPARITSRYRTVSEVWNAKRNMFKPSQSKETGRINTVKLLKIPLPRGKAALYYMEPQ